MISVRPATPHDAAVITAIWLEAWRGAYRGIVPEEAIARRTDEAAAAYWKEVLLDPERSRLVLVAELPNSSVVGFTQAGVPEPEEPGYEIELWKLYISPDARRQGVGRALMRAMAQRLQQDGFSTMCLRAFVGNRAADFYTRMGGQKLREEPYEILGSVAPTILYGWPDLTVLCLDEDATLQE
jgi:ribosomal protein S18 acetylase RimI-like enzyme